MTRTTTLTALLSALLVTLAAPPARAEGNIITVEAGSIGATTTLGGTVVPFKEVSFTAQMPGRVEYIAGVEGDWFKSGTVLVALDNDDLLAKRRAAQAALDGADINWKNARVQYTRQVYSGSDYGGADNTGMGMPRMWDYMVTRPMSSMMGMDNPELSRRARIYNQGTQIDQAQTARAQAQASLQELEAKLRDTKSIAPFSGVIVSKHIEKGNTVQPGMPLLTFADTRNLQIKVDIPARLMPGVQKDMIIPAKLDVGDTRIETRVAQIYPMADAQRHTVTVKLDMPKDSPGGPGMYAEVLIPDVTTPVKNLPIVPKAAVIWRGSLPAVLVAADQRGGDAQLRMIRLGGFVDDKSVSVLSGLSVGERILATPPSGMATDWNPSAGHPAGKKMEKQH
ncbi:MAG: efflux RND transporter periplasmic adaptor subunit [Magnetococcales bacterium]|nr:efflux RND transporter periplasmic adaptor subunit [Magnetococcales bacterium]NGZ05858.1 efflux RND transporter periplasmic adaptor subunit [Magnetococcales bacterium]